MYNCDDEHYEPEPYLFTHQYGPITELPTEPFPTLPLAPVLNPVRATEPIDATLPTHSVEMSAKELMWALMVISGLAPILGALGGGFIGFFVGTVIGIALGIVGVVVRQRRIKAIAAGRTDLAFTDREVKAELAIGAVIAGLAVAKAVGAAERHHARLVAEEIQRGQW